MRTTIRGTLIAAIVAAGGCQRETVPIVYQPPIEMSDWAAGVQVPDNTYRLLQTGATEGRFASGMAVARLARISDSDLPEPGTTNGTLHIHEIRPNEQSYWTESLRGVPGVRDLEFLSPISARFHGNNLDGLCTAAQRVGAQLLLTYWHNRLGENSAELAGVVYDVETRRPLAVLHASSRFLNEDGIEESPDAEEGDYRLFDAPYQAARAFNRYARACMNELIRLDNAAPTTQPHQWDTERRDRWWLPTKIKIERE